jgi:hypothetical protein
MQTTTRQKFEYRIESRDGRIVAKFSLMSEAMVAADALAAVYPDGFVVVESRYDGYVHRTFA